MYIYIYIYIYLSEVFVYPGGRTCDHFLGGVRICSQFRAQHTVKSSLKGSNQVEKKSKEPGNKLSQQGGILTSFVQFLSANLANGCRWRGSKHILAASWTVLSHGRWCGNCSRGVLCGCRPSIHSCAVREVIRIKRSHHFHRWARGFLYLSMCLLCRDSSLASTSAPPVRNSHSHFGVTLNLHHAFYHLRGGIRDFAVHLPLAVGACGGNRRP